MTSDIQAKDTDLEAKDSTIADQKRALETDDGGVGQADPNHGADLTQRQPAADHHTVFSCQFTRIGSSSTDSIPSDKSLFKP